MWGNVSKKPLDLVRSISATLVSRSWYDRCVALGKRRKALVDGAHEGTFLDACVRRLFALSWNEARAAIESGKIACDGEVLLQPTLFARVGSTLELNPNAKRPRPQTDLSDDALVHVDAHVVVVEKPAGISTIPYDETEVGTLDVRVRAALGMQPGTNLGVVHRIDKETSGLVVFTRSWVAKQSLSSQFRAHTVHRRYLALVHGEMRSQTIRSHLIEDRGDGLRGSIEAKHAWVRKVKGDDFHEGKPKSAGSYDRNAGGYDRNAGSYDRNAGGHERSGGRERTGGVTPTSKGVLAVTHVEVLEHLDGASLIACRLETGKTHQIRIHLSELGHPLVGERVYSRGFEGAEIPAERMMLHATELGFTHPKTEAEVQWTSEPPRDFRETLARLRG
jgi:23S rRNA pseudouridine1911/1915/1917 synthase